MNNKSPAMRVSVPPLPDRLPKQTNILFTDVDDTLTWAGQLPVETFAALHQLRDNGIEVVPVTGGCAGWCDCLIKTWPISTIIGENGALYMEKDATGIVHTHYLKEQGAIAEDLLRLRQVGEALQQKFPLIGYTQDQPFRLTDIAFDIGQTVTVDDETVRQATAWLIEEGLQARMSSIHINVWLGSHTKATAAMGLLARREVSMHECMFVGDSPNDESMFEHIPVSVGVANIARFLDQLNYPPTYVTKLSGGHGFAELAEVLVRR